MYTTKGYQIDVYEVKVGDKLFNREMEIITEYVKNSVLGNFYMHTHVDVDKIVPIIYLTEESDRFIKRINEKILSK